MPPGTAVLGTAQDEAPVPMEFHRQMQPVHLTVAMVNEMPPEDRQTIFGPNRVCLEQRRLRQMCRDANATEIDLTSGEKFPWKQMLRCIPFEKAQRIIRSGITKFTFRLLSQKHCFEISCLDGTKWRVMQHDAEPKRIANDNEAYTWCEFRDHYGHDSTRMWQKAKPVDETVAVFIKIVDSGHIAGHNAPLDPVTLACPITRPPVLPDWYCRQPQTQPDVDDVPITTSAAAASKRLLMVGLWGPRGVGRSTLAKGLAQRFASPIDPICLDEFQNDFQGLCDFLDYLAHTIRSGLKVKTSKQPDHHVPDTIIIVVEGFVAFYNKALCERLHLHLWVAADCDTCLERLWLDGGIPGPFFEDIYRNKVWAQYLLYRDQQLNNVPAAVHLDGKTLAPQPRNLSMS